MNQKQKIEAVTRLIEMARAADDIILTARFTIGRLLGDDEAGILSKNHIFDDFDHTPRHAAVKLVEKYKEDK